MKKYFSQVLRHTILPRDPSVVLNGTYLKNPTHLCRRHEDLDLVVVVHTSLYNFERRRLLRHTFMRQLKDSPYTVQLVFMIGTHNKTKINAVKEVTLRNENRHYGDFVQMDFNEDFRNLSLKAVMWLRWLNEHCQNPSVVLKIDDDVILDLRRILPLSVSYFAKFKRSIFCHLNKLGTQPIPRIGRTKVDMREFFNLTIYPYNYCSGFIVFLSPDMIPLLMSAARRTPFYNVDDLFMFGVLPKVVGDVTYHNIGFNVSVWNQKVRNCTTQHGASCRYFGTMTEDKAEAWNLLNAFDHAHRYDFKIPRMKILK
ncbi:acetylgalactosaminyl-O-glycosyl-glycoprotein beta-1,3-N-acetylglucosaminyltransferase-like [Aplysia californica]|uniref:Hexosyltransferase n=1 Tax=Aplysia californica TaxID=6500 RepID=A0ABM0JXV5_APLCA|nr:acetylgalactosaminyl-O-glycosyl-glycoprotein beta-1,3-N-acetylglucosaminyltransferase-like [Aplysia californica]